MVVYGDVIWNDEIEATSKAYSNSNPEIRIVQIKSDHNKPIQRVDEF